MRAEFLSDQDRAPATASRGGIRHGGQRRITGRPVPTVSLLTRALVLAMLAGALILPLADHHAGSWSAFDAHGGLPLRQAILHHHDEGAAAGERTSAPALLPGLGANGALFVVGALLLASAMPRPIAVVGSLARVAPRAPAGVWRAPPLPPPEPRPF